MSASPELAGNGTRPAPVCRCGQVHVVENRDQPLATSLRHDQALQPDSIRRVAPIRALCPCHLPGHIHRCHVRLEVFDADDGVMNRAVPERLLVVRRSPVRDVSSGTSLPHNIHVFRICSSEFCRSCKLVAVPILHILGDHLFDGRIVRRQNGGWDVRLVSTIGQRRSKAVSSDHSRIGALNLLRIRLSESRAQERDQQPHRVMSQHLCSPPVLRMQRAKAEEKYWSVTPTYRTSRVRVRTADHRATFTGE